MIYEPPISPYNIFQSPKDEVIRIKGAHAEITAGSNSEIVAAVSGKVIRVITAIVGPYTFGADAYCAVCTGTTSTAVSSFPVIALQGSMIFPRNDCGWWETVVSEKLIFVAGTAGLMVSIRYVEITP